MDLSATKCKSPPCVEWPARFTQAESEKETNRIDSKGIGCTMSDMSGPAMATFTMELAFWRPDIVAG